MNLRRAIAVFRGEHELQIDIIGRRRMWFLLSGSLVAISLFGLLGPGLNLGIDFEGGALLTYRNESGASVQQIQGTLQREGHGEGIVQLTGEDSVRVRTESLGEERSELLDALGATSGIDSSEISVEDIGPKWGRQISVKALQGLVIFLVAVTIYITFRFEWKMAIGGIASMFHDLIITAGVYALVGREVTPETVIAILTILGYSLYDTVVIFDRIKENTINQGLVARETYGGAVNMSLNQVLMRSFNTTLTTMFPVVALLLFGGETLESFAFALFIGLLLGAYSSVFVAAPLVALLKEREPRLAEIRQVVARREARPSVRAVDAPAPQERELVPAATKPAGTANTAPRRRGKKKSRAKRRRR
ncbi:MAG TPA: protein translocase subunit SecF [Actinomycetota bacterium]|nr:protein translocase subunit SecF [Actinomycetota bacterium]